MVSLAATPSHSVPDDPIDTVIARLDEPGTAASLNQILDHLDLIALLVTGLDQFVSRGDTIADSLAGGLTDLRATSSPVDVGALVSAGQQFAAAAPGLMQFLPVAERLANSDLGDPALVDVASRVARAAIRGADEAERSNASITGVRALLKLLKDPDVSRGLGFLASIAKALGAELRTGRPTAQSTGHSIGKDA